MPPTKTSRLFRLSQEEAGQATLEFLVGGGLLMAALALLLALALATLSRILFVHYSGQWLLCLEATAPKAKECEAQFQSKMAQALPWTSLHIEQTDVSPRQIQSQVTLKYNSEFKFIKALNFSEQLKLHRAQVYGKKDWKWYTQ